MSAKFKKNAKVQWKWLGRAVLGVVEEVYFESITRTIKGKKITRNGSEDKPAYLVRSEAGNEALKLETELLKAVADKKVARKKATSKPKMFG